jgi:hypothetical protein
MRQNKMKNIIKNKNSLHKISDGMKIHMKKILISGGIVMIPLLALTIFLSPNIVHALAGGVWGGVGGFSPDVRGSVNNYEEFTGGEVGISKTVNLSNMGSVGGGSSYSDCVSATGFQYSQHTTPEDSATGDIWHNITIKYFAQVINKNTGQEYANNAVIPNGADLILRFVPHKNQHVFWYIIGGWYDSPYGSWDKDLKVPDASKRTLAYTCAHYRPAVWDGTAFGGALWGGANGTSTIAGKTPVYWSVVVQPPAKSLGKVSGLTCGTASIVNGATEYPCKVVLPLTAAGKPDTTTQTANFVFGATNSLTYGNDFPLGHAHVNNSPAYHTFPTTTLAFNFKVSTATSTANPTVIIRGATTTTPYTTKTYTITGTDPDETKLPTLHYFANVDKSVTNGKLTTYNVGPLPANPNYVVSGTSQTFTAKWSDVGDKKVCVVAQSKSEALSNWSCLNVTVACPDDQHWDTMVLKCVPNKQISINKNYICSSDGLSATISWSSVPGSAGYRVYNALPPANLVGSTIIPPTTTGVVDAPGSYKVANVDSKGKETFSKQTLSVSCSSTCNNGATNWPACDNNNGTSTPVLSLCTGTAPVGDYVIKDLGGTSSSTWTYIENDDENHIISTSTDTLINGQCKWTCFASDSSYTYSQGVNRCIATSIHQ